MSSHARPGSAPRPDAAPHPDASHAGAFYVDAAFGAAGFESDAAMAGDRPPFAADPYAEAPWADHAYANGSQGTSAYAGGSYASGYGRGRQGGDHGGGSGDGREGGLTGGAYAVGGSRQHSSSHHDSGGSPRLTRTEARAAARARVRRKRLKRTSFLGVGSVAAVAVIAVAGFVNPHHDSGGATQADPPVVPVAGRTGNGDASRSVDRPTPAAFKQLPGLGPGFIAKVPADAQQVLLVTGTGKGQNTGTAVLYTRTAAGGWLPGPTWAARNAKNGWTTDHHAGDLHSPIGVFSLTDAGGLDANPGTKLPYTHSSAFQAPGTGFEGESLADAFDYVVAINYNHVPGTSPLSDVRPMGAARGGGIWVHVDHGGPTHGCVALAKDDMRALLLALDPSKHPVIVMGDAASLAQ